MRTKRFVAALAVTLFTASGLLLTPHSGKAAEYVKPIQIQVSYQLPLQGAADSSEDRMKLLEQGRKMVYRMAARECTLITAEIAETCALRSLSVRNGVRSMRRTSTITMTGSASYEITLKSAD